jgi:hypothetical protein
LSSATYPAIFWELIRTPFRHVDLVWGIVPLYFGWVLNELTAKKANFRTALQTGFALVWSGAHWGYQQFYSRPFWMVKINLLNNLFAVNVCVTLGVVSARGIGHSERAAPQISAGLFVSRAHSIQQLFHDRGFSNPGKLPAMVLETRLRDPALCGASLAGDALRLEAVAKMSVRFIRPHPAARRRRQISPGGAPFYP